MSNNQEKADKEISKARAEIGKVRVEQWQYDQRRRPQYRVMPIQEGLTDKDVSEDELADVRLGIEMDERSSKLDEILKNTEETVKLTRKIYVGLANRKKKR